jgi:hypothetical protein
MLGGEKVMPNSHQVFSVSCCFTALCMSEKGMQAQKATKVSPMQQNFHAWNFIEGLEGTFTTVPLYTWSSTPLLAEVQLQPVLYRFWYP